MQRATLGMLTIALLLVLASCGEQEQDPQLDEEQAARESAEQQVEDLEQQLEEESAAREEVEEQLEEESSAREEAEEQLGEALGTIEEADETAESEPAAEPEDSDSDTVGVGETFSYEVFDVTLSNPRIEEQRTDAIFGDSVVGPFLVADLTLTNQGESYESINPFSVTLYTDETSTDDIFQDTVGEQEDPFQDVAPGATREGVLAIEFDQNQTPLFVGFSEGLDDVARVELADDLAEVGTDNPESEVEEAAGDYYRAAGSEDWQYTYDYLDSETQSMFMEEEWFQKNQWFADADSTIYHISSVEMENTSDEPLAAVDLSLTSEDGSSWTRSTYFVLEEGVWKHRFSQEEVDHFMPGVPLGEFVAAHGG